MNKRLQGFVAGILFCVLFTGIGVYAKNRTEMIEVLYNNIKIYKDNVLCELKDANGTVIEPFILNGTTYLPVRGTANLAGMEVTWDGATQSIYLWDYLPNLTDTTYLMDVCPPYQTNEYKEYLSKNGKNFEMSGEKYSNGFILGDNQWGVEAYALFNLNSKYSDITFTIGHVDGTEMYDQEVLFFVDGKLVKTIEIGATDLAKEVSIPVEYGLQLKILRSESFAELGFGNITVK